MSPGEGSPLASRRGEGIDQSGPSKLVAVTERVDSGCGWGTFLHAGQEAQASRDFHFPYVLDEPVKRGGVECVAGHLEDVS